MRPIPEPELVVQSPHHRAWALGGVRGEVIRSSTRHWRWRVWYALGGELLAYGSSLGVRRATADCVKTLQAAAGLEESGACGRAGEDISAQAWAEFGRWLHRWHVAHPDEERTALELLEQVFSLQEIASGGRKKPR